MYPMKKIAIACMLAWCVAAGAQTDPAAQFAAETDALLLAKSTKKITELEYSQGVHRLIKQYMPTDYDAQTLAAYRVMLATKLQDKQISQAEFNYMFEERRNAYLAKREQDERAEQRGQAQAAAADRDRQTAATAAFLRGVGNAARNAAPAPATNCTSTVSGNQVFTRC
jgi:hypothetical protein